MCQKSIRHLQGDGLKGLKSKTILFYISIGPHSSYQKKSWANASLGYFQKTKIFLLARFSYLLRGDLEPHDIVDMCFVLLAYARVI